MFKRKIIKLICYWMLYSSFIKCIFIKTKQGARNIPALQFFFTPNVFVLRIFDKFTYLTCIRMFIEIKTIAIENWYWWTTCIIRVFVDFIFVKDFRQLELSQEFKFSIFGEIHESFVFCRKIKNIFNLRKISF